MRSRQTIESGEFVTELVGEIIQSNDFNFAVRIGSYNSSECKKLFGFQVYFRTKTIASDALYIRMESYSNVGRFVNHSCDANLLLVPVFIEHNDYRCPQIALFAQRKILSGEELTFDYGDEYWVKKARLCFCGR